MVPGFIRNAGDVIKVVLKVSSRARSCRSRAGARSRPGAQHGAGLLLQGGVVVIRNQLVAEVHRLHRGAGAEPVAAQDGGEGLPEVRVEGVDDGVQGGVGPAEPHEDAEGGVADARSRCVRVTERNHAVQDEEREPAEHEHAHDDGQGLQHFGFSLERSFQRTFFVRRRAVPLVLRTGPRRLLQGGDASDLGLCDAENARVRAHHDEHGDVEADEGRGDGVGPVQARVAVLRAVRGPLVRAVPVELHRDEGDEDGQSPRDPDHQEGEPARHPALVPERAGDGPVAVHADDAQVEDGGGGAHDVEGDPGVAEAAEEPDPGDLGHGSPGHHEHGHEQVGHRQRDDERVGDFGAQVAELDDGGAHQRVAQQRGHDQDAQDAAGERAEAESSSASRPGGTSPLPQSPPGAAPVPPWMIQSQRLGAGRAAAILLRRSALTSVRLPPTLSITY